MHGRREKIIYCFCSTDHLTTRSMLKCSVVTRKPQQKNKGLSNTLQVKCKMSGVGSVHFLPVSKQYNYRVTSPYLTNK